MRWRPGRHAPRLAARIGAPKSTKVERWHHHTFRASPDAPAPDREHPRTPRSHSLPHGNGRLLSQVTGATVDALPEAAGPGSGSPFVSCELRHLGGELGRRRHGHGALGALDADYSMFAVGLAPGAEALMAIDIALTELLDAMSPWDAGTGYLNFVETPDHPRRFFDAGTYRRLKSVKAAVDPDGVILANHPI
jgi:hypothetical protein